MDDAYENAMRTVAATYEARVRQCGGKSLARVATIVVNSGSFFNRLQAGKGCSVQNFGRFASWFRSAANWPDGFIPHDAVAALTSIGRPPLRDLTLDVYRSGDVEDPCEQGRGSQGIQHAS
jgi:hypothetical protein